MNPNPFLLSDQCDEKMRRLGAVVEHHRTWPLAMLPMSGCWIQSNPAS